MEQLIDAIRAGLGTEAGQRWLFVATIGAIAFLFLLGVSYLLVAAADPVRRRLADLVDERRPAYGEWLGRLLESLRPAARYLEPGSSSRERGKIERLLGYAGFRRESAVSLFYALKTGLALAMLLATLAVSPLLPTLSSTGLAVLALAATFVGLTLPNTVLAHLAERRQKRLRDGFPDALDLLVVCVESGLGLTAALQRVAEELHFSHPELAMELQTVTAEMRAGVERETALRALASRTGLEDVRGLVSLLVQTLRFGTSIGDTLRVYSEEFRDKRMQRAEELAAKIGTKLIFPLVFCLFPSFFTVAIGPAVIRIIEVFNKLGESVAK